MISTLVIIGAYLLGSIPFGYLIVRARSETLMLEKSDLEEPARQVFRGRREGRLARRLSCWMPAKAQAQSRWRYGRKVRGTQRVGL